MVAAGGWLIFQTYETRSSLSGSEAHAKDNILGHLAKP